MRADKLAKPPADPGGKPIPLKVGDTLELNDHRAVVVGICQVTRTFQSQPVIYTTYSRATTFAPRERKLLSFVLVKAKPGQDLHALTRRIREPPGWPPTPRTSSRELTYDYFMKNTGIPINFGIAVVLGFLVGTAIAGQTFYNFTLENLRQFGALKAMGASNGTLLRMILLQASWSAASATAWASAAASLFGWAMRNTEPRLPAALAAAGCSAASAVTLICIFAALLSIRKVMKLEPAIVFKG